MRKGATIVALILIILFVIAEVGARLIGYPTYEYKPREWKVSPKNFFVYDSLLGYKLDTGVYTYAIEGKQYKSTHNNRGQRITSMTDTFNNTGKRNINFLGGTNVYGTAMSDEETLPFIFQSMFRDFKVQNMAVPEYSMGTNYVLLTRCTKIEKGDVFVCLYFSAHDSRPPRKLQKTIYAGIKSGTLESFPTISIDDNLKTRLNDYSYNLWFLNNYSAAINFAEDRFNKYADQHSKAHETARKVIKAISDSCKVHGATFVLVGRRNDTQTLSMLEYCSKNGVFATYLPMAGKSLIKSPKDKIEDKKKFARMLMDYLKQNKIVDDTELTSVSAN